MRKRVSCLLLVLQALYWAAASVQNDLNIPVFWINQDGADARRSSMKQFLQGTTNTRIPAVGRSDIKAVQGQVPGFTNRTLLGSCSSEGCWKEHQKGYVSETEAAITYSHLTAVATAYEQGCELALIMEDDLQFSNANKTWPHIMAEIHDLAAMAPSDWKVLQLMVSNAAVVRWLGEVDDLFVPWTWYHYAAMVYLINRQGLAELMQTFYLKDIVLPTAAHLRVFTLPTRRFVADELLFHHTKSYTSTRFLFNFATTSSGSSHQDKRIVSQTVLASTESILRNRMRPLVPTHQQHIGTDVLVLTVLRSSPTEATPVLTGNLRYLAHMPQVSWLYHIVLGPAETESSWAPTIGQAKALVGDRVQFAVTRLDTHQRDISDWALFHKASRLFSLYEYVFLLGSAVDVTGFPVGEFFHRLRHDLGTAPVITGAPLHTDGGRCPVSEPVYDSAWWFVDHPQPASTMLTDWAHPHLAVVNGGFFTWFLQRLFAGPNDANVHNASDDTGPAALWCGAAQDFAPGNVSCALIPLPAVCKAQGSPSTHTSSAAAHRRLTAYYARRFPRWWEHSHPFRMAFNGPQGRRLSPTDWRSPVPGLSHAPRDPLRVSVMIVTFDRPEFLGLALDNILQQDYPVHEVVIVDDSPEALPRDLPPLGLDQVKYIHLPARTTIGAKRNVACAAATGDVLVHWDDDDYFHSSRLRVQVAPLQEGLANVTVLTMTHVLVLPKAAFYTAVQFGPHYGTLAYRRSVWQVGDLQFHNVSFAEDAMFLLHALGQCHAVLTLPSPVAVYARHGANALSWPEHIYAEEGPMAGSSRPPWFPELVLDRYMAAAEAIQARPKMPAPAGSGTHDELWQAAMASARPDGPGQCKLDSSQWAQVRALNMHRSLVLHATPSPSPTPHLSPSSSLSLSPQRTPGPSPTPSPSPKPPRPTPSRPSPPHPSPSLQPNVSPQQQQAAPGQFLPQHAFDFNTMAPILLHKNLDVNALWPRQVSKSRRSFETQQYSQYGSCGQYGGQYGQYAGQYDQYGGCGQYDSPSPSLSPSESPQSSPSPSPSVSPSPSESPSQSPSESPSESPSPSPSPSPSSSPSPASSPSSSLSPSPGQSPGPSPSPLPSPIPSQTLTPTFTSTVRKIVQYMTDTVLQTVLSNIGISIGMTLPDIAGSSNIVALISQTSVSVGETAAYGVYDASDGALPTIDGGDLGSIAITDWGSGVAKAIIIVHSVGDSQAILSKDLTQHSSLPASSGVVSILRWDENGNKITGSPVTFHVQGNQASCNPTDTVEIWRYADESTEGSNLANDGGSYELSSNCANTSSTGCCYSVYSPLTSSFLAFAGQATTNVVTVSPSPSPSPSPSTATPGSDDIWVPIVASFGAAALLGLVLAVAAWLWYTRITWPETEIFVSEENVIPVDSLYHPVTPFALTPAGLSGATTPDYEFIGGLATPGGLGGVTTPDYEIIGGVLQAPQDASLTQGSSVVGAPYFVAGDAFGSVMPAPTFVAGDTFGSVVPAPTFFAGDTFGSVMPAPTFVAGDTFGSVVQAPTFTSGDPFMQPLQFASDGTVVDDPGFVVNNGVFYG